MDRPELIVRGRRVVLPEGTREAAVHVRGGRVVAVREFDDAPRGCEVFEAGDAVLMPGLVDTHVHVNEPGRAGWEGFETATRAAAAGGTTSIVEMPLNSVPATTTLESLKTKLAAAEGKCAVDVAFWGGVVPGNTSELAPMTAAGVVGFKCFLVDSGVAEFAHVSEEDLRESLPELARLDALLIVHAELPQPIEAAAARAAKSDEDPRRYATFLAARPRAAEDAAVALMIRLSRETGARVHIVHHSSADALPALRDAKREGVRITAETCPHYLALAAEEIADGATEFKCCPPIRERENREQLWSALAENLIGMIVSDHSPCPPELKRCETGNFLEAWGGISSLQLRLPVVWTEARRRGHTLEQLCEWLSSAPARLAGLDARKGSIRVGADADFVVWRPEETFRVEPPRLAHRHKLTPYAGRELGGVVEATFLRGEKIFARGEFLQESGGQFLLRGRGGL